MSALTERLQTLYANLPREGAVTLTKADVAELLSLELDAEGGRLPGRDLTTDEIAQIYDVTPGTVLRWIHCGRCGTEGDGWYRLGKRFYVKSGALRETASTRSRKPSVLRLPRKTVG